MDNTPTEETKQILEWISTEIRAGKTLSVEGGGHLWNSSADRCLAIIEYYRRGEGLSQMTANARAKDTVQEPERP